MAAQRLAIGGLLRNVGSWPGSRFVTRGLWIAQPFSAALGRRWDPVAQSISQWASERQLEKSMGRVIGMAVTKGLEVEPMKRDTEFHYQVNEALKAFCETVAPFDAENRRCAAQYLWFALISGERSVVHVVSRMGICSESLKAKIQEKYHIDSVVNPIIDPEIIGGFLFKVVDPKSPRRVDLVDFTAKTALEELRSVILADIKSPNQGED